MSAPEKMSEAQMRAVLIAFAEAEARKLGVDPTGMQIDEDLLLQVQDFAQAAAAARDAQWQARLDAAVMAERAACAQACEDALTLHGVHSNFICARYIKHRTA